MSAKAFYDRSVPTRNLVTTITGIVLLIIQIIVSIGWITPDQGASLQTIVGGVITAVVQIVGYVSAVILMFKAKD
jgi:fumarate reductase subunit D